VGPGLAYSPYDLIGLVYSRHRRPDPRIAAQIEAALGDARTVLDVGAGTGSYEPSERDVVAVEPSQVMIAQRGRGAAPTVRSVAESLPFASGSFDAVLAVLTVHHWRNARLGLKELARVGRRVVVLHFDPAVHNRFWLFSDYVPECNSLESTQIFDHVELAREIGATRTEVVPIPADCIDGFNWAYWNRPAMYLEPEVRACMSGLALLEDSMVAARMEMLRADLADGSWYARHGHLLTLDSVDGGLRLVIRE
jgi:SAM-dependent methyltransferase